MSFLHPFASATVLPDKWMDYSTLDVVRGDAFGNIRRAEAFNRGKQVLGESIVDLAGLLTAHDAYLLSLKGKADVVIDGLTGEQRFFLAFAQRWRKTRDETTLRRQIKTDSHASGECRSDTVRNVEAWYKAYGIAPGDKLYLKHENRVRIW